MVLLESEQVGPRGARHVLGFGARRSRLWPVVGRVRCPHTGRGGKRPSETPGFARPGPRLVGAACVVPGERAGGGMPRVRVGAALARRCGVLVLQFLTELTRLFQKCRTSGSVFITLKKYDGRTKPVPRKGHVESFEPADNKCLLRATDGKKKISTVVSDSFELE
ncbi:hypothetical protein CIB84_003671 [Bambusicola thoracicus]|uniref:Signal recognition particle 14 kDa protein n=1 Tax=Bambusicola thoracicus TaxID=9083 RepID=A0A2P4T8A4_BAMTH|nr:hypothetical protein CIB84_003671 [Bambusicola thoracicus]